MIVKIDEFDYAWFESLPQQKRKRGNNATTQKYYYKDIITAFDKQLLKLPQNQVQFSQA